MNKKKIISDFKEKIDCLFEKYNKIISGPSDYVASMEKMITTGQIIGLDTSLHPLYINNVITELQYNELHEYIESSWNR